MRRSWRILAASAAILAAVAGGACGGGQSATYATTAGACGTLALAVAEAHAPDGAGAGDLEVAERDLEALRGVCDRALGALEAREGGAR